ncbi:unnamed protein product [Rhizoctonia solani]|uniref:Uncharacterized protein n=1 Tax=Rhizoctonia solani TaxID=456999 RepID=A0A8H2WPR7_9AGAM|nr:unnamed protein product [Rhizoctonia solani]
MKSLVALLDRKKKDRANTLVQVPFPSALPHSALHQDGSTSIHAARRISTPTPFLRPPPQHRAASDSRVHRPLVSGYYQGHSPAQNASYYTDSDDSIFVDPFASSPAKLGLTSKSHYNTPLQAHPQRGSEFNSASTLSFGSDRFRVPQEPSAPLEDEPKSQSGAAPATSKKGHWLRERRSLTSLLRPQQPNKSTESVPTVPPVPNRVPERKSSSFFTRVRSGSIPSVGQTAGPAHTTCQRSTVQLPMLAPQPRAINTESKNGPPHRGVTPLTLSHSQADSPDSWVRIGRDSATPTSPTTRRRAISVPLPLSHPTEPPPPVPDVQHPLCIHKPELDLFAEVSPDSALMRRPVTSIERHTRPSHNTHGKKSASVSVPAPARLNAITRHREQEQLAPQLSKQLSVGTAEGLVLKSALKRRPVEPIQTKPVLPVQSVKPLRICKREGAASKTDLSQLPTPSSTSSLQGHHRASVGHTDGARTTSRHYKNTSGSSLEWEYLDSLGEEPVSPQSVATLERHVTSSTTNGSLGSLTKGNGLPSSDSRSLPVLDNIWGSFVSETAFGSSLPPSPVASISTRYQSQETNDREQTGRRSMDPESGTNTSCSSHSETHWKTGSAPPSSPPVTNLPPVPKPVLALGRGPRRKRSRSSANPTALLTPPTSPTEAVELQGLDRAITTSASDDNPPGRSGNKYSVLCQQLGPRLARSASSPSIRPPVSPEIGYMPIDTRGPGALSRLFVQHHKSRSISPSSVSQSSSQCTPVPGTPVAVPPSAANLQASYLGTSSGSLGASSPNILMPREGYVNSLEGSMIDVGIQTPGIVSRGVSDAIMGKPPLVSSNPDATEGDLREELLLTPPITPAWAVHVFDVDSEDNLKFNRMGHSESGDHIPLARTGNLAQMRRQKRSNMRSGSTQFLAEHLHRPSISLPDPKADTRSNNPSKDTTLLARNGL